jgi:glutamate synthase domain-containing protein 3
MERVTAAPTKLIGREKSAVLNVDLVGVRRVNEFLHSDALAQEIDVVQIESPNGVHNLAVGVDADIAIEILGHVGYYVGGMNKRAQLVVHGNAERGVAENMMSGSVRIKGNVSESAGASALGGLLVIEGDAAGRCGISLKGADIVVGGNVGHSAAFMAQAGRIVVCGDTAGGLGDSLYEAVIYVGGRIGGLGADAREEPMTEADYATVAELLSRAELNASQRIEPRVFKRVASARTLYHWNAANHAAY